MVPKDQIELQKRTLEGFRELVAKAPDSEKKERALLYCDGCIDACEIALEQFEEKKKPKKSEKAEEKKPEEINLEDLL